MANQLGDINGDGSDDLVIHCSIGSSPQRYRFIIWTGNDEPFVTLVETTNGSVPRSAMGMGDVNGDDLDDYLLQYGIPGGTNMNCKIVLYKEQPKKGYTVWFGMAGMEAEGALLLVYT